MYLLYPEMSNWIFFFSRFFAIHTNHYFSSCMTALKFSISFSSLGERKHFLNNRFYLGIKRKKEIFKKILQNAIPFLSLLCNLHILRWFLGNKSSQTTCNKKRWVTKFVKELWVNLTSFTPNHVSYFNGLCCKSYWKLQSLKVSGICNINLQLKVLLVLLFPRSWPMSYGTNFLYS